MVISVQREDQKGIDGLRLTIAETKVEFDLVLDSGSEGTSAYSQGAFFTYIIDKSSVIRAILPGTVYQRPTGDQIVKALEQIAQGGG